MSLRARLLLLVLVASIGPLLALLGFLLYDRAAGQETARAQFAARAQAIAADVDDKIAATHQLLLGLARSPAITEGSRETCSAFLAEVLGAHPQYTGLLTIRPDGQLHCDSLRTGRQLDLRDRRYFQRALTTTTTVVEPAIGRLTGKPVLQIAHPVRDAEGRLHGVVVASLDFDAYATSLGAQLPNPQTRLQLWNPDGSVILDRDAARAKPDVRSAAERDFVLQSQGQPRTGVPARSVHLWSVIPLPHHRTDLILVLHTPLQAMTESIDRRFQLLLSGLVAIGVAVFLGAALFGELSLRRQASRLLQGVSRLSAGVFDRPIGRPYPRGELGDVMASIDAMAVVLANERELLQRQAAALKRQTEQDPLTGLANRTLLTLRLEQALESARRQAGATGVMVLDLDRFKTVNDSLGHLRGDLLLQAVAERLVACVGPQDTVARLGGDEFVILIASPRDDDELAAIARRLLTAVAQPVQLEHHTLPVSTSVGIAVHPRDGDDAEKLLQHADAAMYRAKEEGGNTLAFFTRDMMQASVEKLQTEAGLRQALEREELVLHLQPIIDAASGQVVCAEALVRWQHPQLGLIPPMQFIPIAEETGLIVPIGEWVLREACALTRRWQREAGREVPIAVNLSARQFSVPDLEQRIAQTLQDTGCPPALLHLEITETTMMQHADQAQQTLHHLKALGVRLSIDDFGTGYSSLSQLKHLPVDKVKIDRSFVRDVPTDPQDVVIVDAIVALSRKLGLRIAAEGVETEAQRHFLAELGCDEYQGYLFSRPCAVKEFESRFLAVSLEPLQQDA